MLSSKLKLRGRAFLKKNGHINILSGMFLVKFIFLIDK